MSLLPKNEAKELHSLDEALARRWQFDVIENPLEPLLCDKKYLPFVAKAYDIDISLLDEAKARAILKTAILHKNKIGTIKAVKNLVQSFDTEAKIVTFADAPRHDGRIVRDGSKHYKNYGLTHWAMYSVELKKVISISQKEELIRQLKIIAPARCVLINIEAQQTITHDREIKRNRNYNYGGYING
jgi:phage tail P2-like protein